MAKTQDHSAADATARVVPHPAVNRQSPERLLQRVWERWQSFTNDRLRQLLLDIDDDLFARADASESNIMQEMYFNAMRLLRYQTDDIRARFASTITASAASSAPSDAGDRGERAGVSSGSRTDELSLVDEDVLEQRLAVATMHQRFERTHTLEVLMAQRRIEALREQLEPGSTARKISLDARVLAEAFADAVGPLELDLRIRLVLFKHFENEVMEPIAGLFREFNELLRRAGVLPDLDLNAEAKNKQARTAREESPAAPARKLSATEPTVRMPGGRSSAEAAPTARFGVAGTAARPLLPPGFDLEGALKRRNALMRKLPELRHQRRFDHGDDPAQLLDVGTVLQLLEASERLALQSWHDSDLEQLPRRLDFGAFLLEEARRKGRSRAALKGTDEDTVNLLQMLFDLILNDDHLAIPMRALIARLQMPMLRMALVDDSFFSTAKHPARRFLNAISHAGIGWNHAQEKSRDRLYAGIEQLVQRAGSEFRGDATLFDTLRVDLDGLLTVEARRIKLAESSVIAKEQARMTAERTRHIVSRLIQHRLSCAPPLPCELEGFLRTDWQQVLMRTHGHPEPWQSAFAVLRRLTGSGTGPDGSALHGALAQGLRLLAMEPAAADRAAAQMLSLWNETAKARQRRAPTPSAAAAATADDPQLELAELTAAANDEADGLADAPAPGSVAMAAAQALAEQTWVELRTRSAKLMRCRLASIIEPPERCIFLNRRGLRIETLSRLELAQAIEQGRLRVLDDRQLFDRALEQVIGSLRSVATTTE